MIVKVLKKGYKVHIKFNEVVSFISGLICYILGHMYYIFKEPYCLSRQYDLKYIKNKHNDDDYGD